VAVLGVGRDVAAEVVREFRGVVAVVVQVDLHLAETLARQSASP
jgi:hypothetical protein